MTPYSGKLEANAPTNQTALKRPCQTGAPKFFLTNKAKGMRIPKLLYLVFLVSIAAILACGGEDGDTSATSVPATEPAAATAIPAPTDTPQPTTAPTATTALTAMPEPTEAAMMRAEGRAITPLASDNPLAAAAEFSEAELACFMDVTDLSRLMLILGDPEAAAPEERVQLVSCMEDETVLRLFLTTSLLTATGPLSEETSACIREGFAPLDLRGLMSSAGLTGDPGESQIHGLAIFLVMTSCLNDDEWNAAAPLLGLGARDAEGTDCVLEELGGPLGVAEALLQTGDSGIPEAFIAAIVQCGVEFAPVPPDNTGMNGDGTSGVMPGPAIAGMVDQETFLSERSESELSCFEELGVGPEEVTLAFGGEMGNWATPASMESRDSVVNCLDDDSVLQVFLGVLIGQTEPLSEGTSGCISDGFSSLDIRGVLNPTFMNPSEVMQVSTVAFNVAIACINDAEWEANAPRLGLTSEERVAGRCLMTELGGPSELAQAMMEAAYGLVDTYAEAAESCGIDLGPLPGG